MLSVNFHGLDSQIGRLAILLGTNLFYGCQSYTLRANQSVESKRCTYFLLKFLFFSHFNFKRKRKNSSYKHNINNVPCKTILIYVCNRYLFSLSSSRILICHWIQGKKGYVSYNILVLANLLFFSS